jgi:anthranilate phosphoribosyltransferase
LKIRTIFNLVGPFANPARTKKQLIGVPSPLLLSTLAAASRALGYTRVLLVSSRDGMDEISTRCPTDAILVTGNQTKKFVIDPKKLGFKRPPTKALDGGSATENARILRAVLAGEHGHARDVVVLNAGVGLYVHGKAQSIKEGIALATRSIDNGNALACLEHLITESQDTQL